MSEFKEFLNWFTHVILPNLVKFIILIYIFNSNISEKDILVNHSFVY